MDRACRHRQLEKRKTGVQCAGSLPIASVHIAPIVYLAASVHIAPIVYLAASVHVAPIVYLAASVHIAPIVYL